MSGGQLLRAWDACTDHSRLKIYVHIILLMIACSAIFNFAMWLNISFMVEMIGLAIGLIVPPNIFFYNVFTPRRAALRQFIEENLEEFSR